MMTVLVRADGETALLEQSPGVGARHMPNEPGVVSIAGDDIQAARHNGIACGVLLCFSPLRIEQAAMTRLDAMDTLSAFTILPFIGRSIYAADSLSSFNRSSGRKTNFGGPWSRLFPRRSQCFRSRGSTPLSNPAARTSALQPSENNSARPSSSVQPTSSAPPNNSAMRSGREYFEAGFVAFHRRPGYARNLLFLRFERRPLGAALRLPGAEAWVEKLTAQRGRGKGVTRPC